MQFALSAEDKNGNKVIDDAKEGQIQNREILLNFIYSTPEDQDPVSPRTLPIYQSSARKLSPARDEFSRARIHYRQKTHGDFNISARQMVLLTLCRLRREKLPAWYAWLFFSISWQLGWSCANIQNRSLALG